MDTEQPYASAGTVCGCELCDRPAWADCPEGRCLFHSAQNDRNEETARLVWKTARTMLIKEDIANFRGWHFPEDPDLWIPTEGCIREMIGDVVEEEAEGLYQEAAEDLAVKGAEGALSKNHCRAMARFDNAQFEGRVSFIGAQFNSDACFEGAEFKGEVRCDAALFRGSVQFGKAQFKGDARFNGAQIEGKALFDEAQFWGKANFDAAQFREDAIFQGVRFAKNVSFTDVYFGRWTCFERARFQGNSEFCNAEFTRAAWFSEAQIEGNCSFHNARFGGGVMFMGATFEAAASFLGARPSEGAFISFDRPHRRRTPRPFRHPREGESAYRLAKQAAQGRGDYGSAGAYHYAEQCAIEADLRNVAGLRLWRAEFWLWIGRFLFGRLVFGYGERPWHPLLVGLAVILVWAGLYVLFGAIGPEAGTDPSVTETIETGFGEALYFSVVTFTTLGYGDIQPKPPYRILAATEAVLGAVSMATFVVCLTRKYMR